MTREGLVLGMGEGGGEDVGVEEGLSREGRLGRGGSEVGVLTVE